jgi:hypothetical protein
MVIPNAKYFFAACRRHHHYPEDVALIGEIAAVGLDEPHPLEMLLVALGHEAASRPWADAIGIGAVSWPRRMMVDAIPARREATVLATKTLVEVTIDPAGPTGLNER